MRVRFRGVQRREGVLIWGACGVGEFSPFEEYDDDESAGWLAAALEAADGNDAAPLRQAVPVNCTVPAVDQVRAAAIVRAGHGCRTAKVKVAEPGQTLDHDIARVATVRDAIGPGGRVRVDANGAWSVERAVEAINRLAEFDLEYVEQPVASVEGLAEVRRRVDVPIAADESIRRVSDPMRVTSFEAADIAVLKVQPLGGVRSCLDLADKMGLPVVVSSALESSVGIAAGVALAAAIPDLPYACGLATASMLSHDLTRHPMTPVDGCIQVRPVVADDGLVAAARPADDVVGRWLSRLARCHQVLRSRQR
ncbi:MAG: o-succinylbenzoate synthase [Propionibacteriales bacterium]|nr:o-succinylbenzoate synthase [Propionibacteriales bacterium]